jgi:hypothetical protein
MLVSLSHLTHWANDKLKIGKKFEVREGDNSTAAAHRQAYVALGT